MKKRNIIYSVLIIALGVFAFIYAGRYASALDLRGGSTGGDFFPRLISVGLILTGITIAAFSLLSKNMSDDCAAIKWAGLGINIAAFLVYFLLLKTLGFIVDSIWIIAFVMVRLGCRKYVFAAIYSVVMPTLIFCLFYYCLYVSLPLGVLASVLPKY